MTVYIGLYLASLLISGAAAYHWGGYREQRVWCGFLAYWVLVWAFISGHPWSIPLNILVNAIMAWMMYRHSHTIHGDRISFVFACLCILGGLALFGMVSIEKGQGVFAATYWNFRTILLHVACWILVVSSYARRTQPI